MTGVIQLHIGTGTLLSNAVLSYRLHLDFSSLQRGQQTTSTRACRSHSAMATAALYLTSEHQQGRCISTQTLATQQQCHPLNNSRRLVLNEAGECGE